MIHFGSWDRSCGTAHQGWSCLHLLHWHNKAEQWTADLDLLWPTLAGRVWAQGNPGPARTFLFDLWGWGKPLELAEVLSVTELGAMSCCQGLWSAFAWLLFNKCSKIPARWEITANIAKGNREGRENQQTCSQVDKTFTPPADGYSAG